jgi:hypothetical protein
LSQGIILTLNDPSDYSQASVNVQLQNNSGFALTVQSSGATYSIMPFFAQTIPTLGGGQSITVLPTNPIQSAGNQTGGLTVVWLLTGQTAPIQDGALTPIIINSREQSQSSYTPTPPSYTYVYPLQATDQSQEFLFFPVGGAGYSVSYTITGTTSGHVYASGTVAVASTGSTPIGAFQAFGSIDSSITLYLISTVAPKVQAVFFTSALNTYISNTSQNPVIVDTTAGVPLATYTYGGGAQSSVSTTGTSSTLLLAAPASGYATRIHSVAMFYSGTASTTPVIGRFTDSTSVFSVVTYPYQNTIYLGGLLIYSSINVIASSSTSTIWVINYDTVLQPTIS